MVEFNIYVMFKLYIYSLKIEKKIVCNLITCYTTIQVAFCFSTMDTTNIYCLFYFILCRSISLSLSISNSFVIYLLIDTIFWIQEINKIVFHIYLIMKAGNFIYYNIKELVAIRLISIRNWNYLHTLHVERRRETYNIIADI
jgi:hypothetical protein